MNRLLKICAPSALILIAYACLIAAEPKRFYLALFFLIAGFVPVIFGLFRLRKLQGKSIYFEIVTLIILGLFCKSLTYIFQFCNVITNGEGYQFFSVVGLGDAGFFLFLFAVTLVMTMGLSKFNLFALLITIVFAGILFYSFRQFGRLNDAVHLFCICLAAYGALLRFFSKLKNQRVFMGLILLFSVSILIEIWFLDMSNIYVEDWFTTINTALSCLLIPAVMPKDSSAVLRKKRIIAAPSGLKEKGRA